MRILFLSSIVVLLFFQSGQGQEDPSFSIRLKGIELSGLPGLHSFAFAQHEGKWLLIGGRKDGLHARQPFASFPANQNNATIFVVDIHTGQYWSAPTNQLNSGLNEQLSSTNMNFIQHGDTLYLTGGYAYSTSAGDHITFPYLTTIFVPGLIDAIRQGSSINGYFRQIQDDRMAVTGGQLGRMGTQFYLVGGQWFKGRYNPMDHPTFEQLYTDQIRKFSINHTLENLEIASYSTITDGVHLHRRDYNLVPQIFPDGKEGYLVSSGVFQPEDDLPFLYPVEITEEGFFPKTNFSQYLSHYHSPKAGLYDSANNTMYSLFFGGMSQYYFEGDELVQNDLVPFVRTISMLTRQGDGTLQEYRLETEMPALLGAGAEFILNPSLPRFPNEVIRLDGIDADSILLGHIFGGIKSYSLNPFSNNQTSQTLAANEVFEVWLIRDESASIKKLDGTNPYKMTISPNPSTQSIRVSTNAESGIPIRYMLSTLQGKWLQGGEMDYRQNPGKFEITPSAETSGQPLILTLIFDGKYFVSAPVIYQP